MFSHSFKINDIKLLCKIFYGTVFAVYCIISSVNFCIHLLITMRRFFPFTDWKLVKLQGNTSRWPGLVRRTAIHDSSVRSMVIVIVDSLMNKHTR